MKKGGRGERVEGKERGREKEGRKGGEEGGGGKSGKRKGKRGKKGRRTLRTFCCDTNAAFFGGRSRAVVVQPQRQLTTPKEGREGERKRETTYRPFSSSSVEPCSSCSCSSY